MPRVEFFRNDLSIRVGRDSHETRLRLEYQTLGGKRWTQAADFSSVQSGARLDPPAPALKDWNATTSTLGLIIKRACLDIRDEDLTALPWETVFSHLGPVVRRSLVKPVLGIEPLKLPLRIDQVGSWQPFSLATVVYGLFGRRTQPEIHDAVHVRNVAELSLPTQVASQTPTSDVLHFVPGVLAGGEKLLSAADPEAVGTLGWLSRCCFVRQTRLVFIACDPDQAAWFMRLGQALTDCGGPAVVVESLPADERRNFWRGFYSDLVHDFPFDAILDRLFQWTSLGGGLVSLDESSRTKICLFAGAGREDEMRVSSIGLRVISIPPSTRAVRSSPRLRTGLNDLRKKWNTYTFEFHESDGLLPLSGTISRLRSAARKAPRARVARVKADRARFVNTGFFADRGAGDPEEIPQEGAWLNWEEMVHLGVDIGPRNPKIVVWGAAPLDEEVFRWKPQMKGIWVEVGITGISFDVIGNPVRELWLPREGASERVYFPVIPRASNGISRLRVCLYHKSNIVQAFRVAALTQVGRRKLDAINSRKKLAASLDLSLNEVGKAGFMAQLEYSTTSVADLAEREAVPEARVSIVANHWDSDTVITVKAPGLQAAQVLSDADIPDDVQKLRDGLLAISTRKFIDNTVGYAFGTPGEPNGGTPEQLENTLTQLVDPGWQLFDKLMLQRERTRLLQVLEANDNYPIHIAHVLRDKVIPWALLYDRPYDANATDAEGKRAGPGVCRAALPDAKGNLPVKQCFGKGCLLEGHPQKSHKDSQGRTLLPESVICPLHFWGFRYLIEIPPQQVAPGAEGTPLCEAITVSGKAKVAVGVNCTLSLYHDHVKELAGASTKTPADWHNPGEYDRGKILKMLEDPDLAAIYFYCHAGGSTKDGARLVFQGPQKGDPKEEIRPADLTGGEWQLRPLVFLNGCNTAGYSPRALSRFFQKLVDDRAAAGVIGTEITVREQLACEMAERFFLSFLDGMAAGPALLKARRVLLGKNNPLGLAYALYASAGLSLTAH
jgi:hypothetical protein